MCNNKQFNETVNKLQGRTIAEVIGSVDVLEEWNNQTTGLDDWFAVASELGIIAYFGEREEAEEFRINYINRLLKRLFGVPLSLRRD